MLMRGVDGEVIAITGASSEVGESAAHLLAAGGARVGLGARCTDRLRDLAARLETGGVTAWAPTDVTRREGGPVACRQR